MSDQEELIYENIAVIKNQKDIHVGGKSWYDSDEPIENAWNKIVKSGKYIGTLAFVKLQIFVLELNTVDHLIFCWVIMGMFSFLK